MVIAVPRNRRGQRISAKVQQEANAVNFKQQNCGDERVWKHKKVAWQLMGCISIERISRWSSLWNSVRILEAYKYLHTFFSGLSLVMVLHCLSIALPDLPDLYYLCLSLVYNSFFFFLSQQHLCRRLMCCWGNAINFCQIGDLLPVKAHCLALRDGNFINSFIRSPVTAAVLPVVNVWWNSL